MRSSRLPDRYDLALPQNQRKLDATESLAQLAEDAGMTLIHLALAFVLRHPAVTSAIIGPRTAEHLASQLGAVDVELSDDVLDRIDAIVAPGTNFSWADAGYIPPGLEDARRRRRETCEERLPPRDLGEGVFDVRTAVVELAALEPLTR